MLPDYCHTITRISVFTERDCAPLSVHTVGQAHERLIKIIGGSTTSTQNKVSNSEVASVPPASKDTL